MAVIGATQLEPVNVLGQYVQGLEAGRGARAQRVKEAQAAQLQNMLMGATPEQLQSSEFINRLAVMPEGATVAKTLSESAAAQRTARKDELDIALKGVEMVAREAGGFLANPSALNKATLSPWVQSAVQRGILQPEDIAKFDALPDDPAQLAGVLQQLQTQGMSLADRLTAERAKRTADIQEGQLRLAERKFEREGEAGPELPKPPQGYRYTAAGDLEPIPGGPKDPKVVEKTERVKITGREAAKRDAAFPKVNASYKAHEAKTDDLVELLGELKEAKGLAQLVGPIESRLPTFRQETADAEAKLKTILARGQFRELQEMRNNSPTGGALGNVSNFEIQALQNAFAQLDTAQSEESFKKAIDRAVEELQRSKRNLREGFSNDFGYRENRAGAIEDGDGDWEDM